MKNILFAFVFALIGNYVANAQSLPINLSVEKNYSISRTPLSPVKTLQELQNLSAQKQGASIVYLDEMGRVSQTIHVGTIVTSNGYRNLVEQHVYDLRGREFRQYLPYSTTMDSSTGGYRSGALTEQASFYQTLYKGQTPYSETMFDGSPLSRPVSQTRLGNPNGQVELPDPTIKDYAKYVVGYNRANQIRMWRVEDDGTLIPKGYYPEATLYLSENTDADGRKSQHYVDLQGRTICTIADPNGINATTQYVYDDYGMLRWVLPPKFNAESSSASMSDAAIKVTSATDLTGVNSSSYVVMGAGSLSLKPGFVGVAGFSASTIGYTQTTLDALAFYYEYDNDGRLIKKKAPGMAPIYYAYDERDRLVAVQDGNQRKLGRWMYYRYDELNRNIESGLLANNVTDQATMQARIDAAYKTGGYTWFDKESGTAYTTTSYPKPTTDGTLTPLSYIWYDYYPTGAPAFDRTKAYADSSSRVLGLITQVKVRTIDDIPNQTASWSTKAIYYDADGQAIQGVSDGTILGNSAKMTVSSKLGWRGQLQEVKEVQTFGTTTTTMLRTYNYYDNGVLNSLTACYNGGTTTTLASYTYDDLGRVKEKLIGNASQSQRYAYNIRGWLTQINDPNSAAGSDLFALKLAYETPEAGTTAAAQYAGNISSATWQSRTSATVATPKKTYGYTYDALNRLTSSDFVGGSSATSLEEKGITYDLNGNILTLNRTDAAGAATSYSYTYNGNQLASVTSSKSGSYTYDDNGNMVTDGRKGMTFTYNPLNLISTVKETGKTMTLYNLYDATGKRLATVNPDGTTTYYHGSMVYSKPATGIVALKYALHDEGMVMANGTYQYLLKDNQGNVRVAYTNNAGQVQVVQSTDYYPYGMPHGVMNADKNPYLYTGKELQNQLVGTQPLNLMDYGARYYDYELGRWHSMDPLADKFNSLSSYVFCGNNPIGLVDNNGMSYKPWNWNADTMGEWTAWKDAGAQASKSNGGCSSPSWGDAYANELRVLWSNAQSNAATVGISVSENGNVLNLTGGYAEVYFEALKNGLNASVGYFSSNGTYVVLINGTGASDNFKMGNPSGQEGGFLDKGLDYASKINDAVDAFTKTLETNGMTALMVSGGKAIARYSLPAGIIINAGQVFNGVRKDGYTYGYNAQKATAGAVGGIAGAWAGFQAGAWAGFEAGFTIGLFFEGVGAIPGSVIGAIVGGFGCAWVGAWGGGKLGESFIRNKAQ